jgi:hypothetical protein
MSYSRVLLAVSLSLGVFAGSILVSELSAPQPWTVEQVLAPAGAVLKFPGSEGVTFTVPALGGVIVGGADLDRDVTIALLPVPTVLHCIANARPAALSGSSWTYSINETLPAGPYYWGPVCDAHVNITVTRAIELLYP